jgi:hypothetical protein
VGKSLYEYVFGDFNHDMNFYEEAVFEKDSSEDYTFTVPYTSVQDNPLFYISGRVLDFLKSDHPTFYGTGGVPLDYSDITQEVINQCRVQVNVVFHDDVNRINMSLKFLLQDPIATESGDLGFTSEIVINYISIDKDVYIQNKPIENRPATQSEKFLVRKIWDYDSDIRSFSYLNSEGWLKIQFEAGEYEMQLNDYHISTFDLIELYEGENTLIKTFSPEDTTFIISSPGVYYMFIRSVGGKLITLTFDKQ